MNTLKPFEPQKAKFLLMADLQIEGSSLDFQFQLQNPDGLKGIDKPSFQSSAPREDNLWKTTCFEAFLKPVGFEAYYEFNFSLKPAWNCYRFSSYRNPQPPTANDEFHLENINWDATQLILKVELQNRSPYKLFEVGLTSIIEEKDGHLHYCALTHGKKADFHLSQNFTLKRGSK